MLENGEKGVVLQKDKKTYAIIPRISGGIITPEILRNLADVSEKYNIPAMKITSATRIALVGIKEEDVDNIWKDLKLPFGVATGKCIKSVKVCPGTAFCGFGQQDSLAMGKELDDKYYGKPLPAKVKVAVSGCPFQCAENCIKDISLFGKKNGWTVMVGGMGGAKPRLAKVLSQDLSDEEALNIFDKVLEYFKSNSNAKKKERIGLIIERVGFENFKKEILN